MPILVGLDGHEKMSKSKGNYVGVTETPDDMFGKLMSMPDALMANYFTLLTDVPAPRLTSLLDPKTTHPREAKDILARILVEEMHSRDAANAASEEFRRRFSEHQLPSNLEEQAGVGGGAGDSGADQGSGLCAQRIGGTAAGRAGRRDAGRAEDRRPEGGGDGAGGDGAEGGQAKGVSVGGGVMRAGGEVVMWRSGE